MKNIGLVCLLLVSICCGLQAKKIVKVPYFMACNTRSIEVEQVTLGKDTTWLAVRLYGMQGDRDSCVAGIRKGLRIFGKYRFCQG